METVHLNLARKLRSKTFDQIIGQPLSVRMLKNSLFLGRFFPVYLFAGKRGCGKTTTARVFAAAVNCDALTDFQKNPKKTVVPCLVCSSCVSMQAGNHPDFIEMDAASHTGVDNVRNIIDAASLLPLMGNKKIYLIDEAHMLSKAAFNALLKILEEPPARALFILATTDPQKIIDTVKSRCFQLVFNAVERNTLSSYLTTVCAQEEIEYEQDSLDLIVQETYGCVRDALNLLEQVRFASGRVSKQSVLSVLGHLGDEHIIALYSFILGGKVQELLRYIKKIRLTLFSADFIWRRMRDIIRASLWLSYGVESDIRLEDDHQVRELVKHTPISVINKLFYLLYSYEKMFIKTAEKHAFLEMILVRLASSNDDNSNSGMSSPAAEAIPIVDGEVYDEQEDDDQFEDASPVASSAVHARWDGFLSAVRTLDDPLIVSLFEQGKFLKYDQATGKVAVDFAKRFMFFQDQFEETSSLWLALLKKNFGQKAVFVPTFMCTDVPKVKKMVNVAPQPQSSEADSSNHAVADTSKKQYQPQRQVYKRTNHSIRPGKTIDVSDEQSWKLAHCILRYFPGSVREL